MSGSLFTILGGEGYVGRAVAASLRARGEDVFVPERGAAEVFDRPLGYVIYAIGLTADFRQRPFDTVEAHVCVLNDILRRAQFESLVYLSSTRLMSGRLERGFAVDPQDPSDLYNISKLMGESICHHSGRAGVKVAGLSNVIGPYDPRSQNFLFTLADEALGGAIRLRSHPDTQKDYIQLEDVVDLLPRIAAEGEAPVYDVGSGIQIPHRAWTEALAERTGCTVELTQDAPLFRFESVDTGPLVREFGYQPRDPLGVLDALLQR